MGALVVFDAARRDHFPDVRVGRLRGEGGAGAQEDREVVAGVENCPVQGRTSLGGPRVDRGAVSEEDVRRAAGDGLCSTRCDDVAWERFIPCKMLRGRIVRAKCHVVYAAAP